ncbi:MAG: hypothetical protein ACKOJ9_00745, partial [Actinomycetota bacterium]
YRLFWLSKTRARAVPSIPPGSAASGDCHQPCGSGQSAIGVIALLPDDVPIGTIGFLADVADIDTIDVARTVAATRANNERLLRLVPRFAIERIEEALFRVTGKHYMDAQFTRPALARSKGLEPLTF